MAKPTLAIYGIKDRNSGGYPCHVHDHNICLMQDGQVLQYLHLERYTRKKFDNRLDSYIEQLIDEGLLSLPDDFDIVSVNNFVGNAFISDKGRLRIESTNYRTLSNCLENARGYLQYSDRGMELTAYNCPHELAHVFSVLPFCEDLLDNSLLVSFDGGSSLGNYSAFLYQNGKIKLIENNWRELGDAAKLFNSNVLMFKTLGIDARTHNSFPGKLMGFASWGCYDEKIKSWLVQNDFFKDYWNRDNEILESIKTVFNKSAVFQTKDSFMQDVASTMQHFFEESVIGKMEFLQQKYKCDNLYYGGGGALNIVTNTRIVESGLFKNVFIAPCCNDSGLSIGAAALLELQKGNKIRMHSPYLNNIGLYDNEMHSVSLELIKKVARIIMAKGIVGVCNGYGEAGPRALGNRSLIALPNDKQLSQRLSMQVKKREWYRPIAPIMLKKVAQRACVQRLSPLSKYMLSDFEIKHEFDEALCGIIHVNQTARIQTLESEEDNPFMFNLLTYLYENYGVMALINTSFNVQGEPIVHTKSDALASAKKMGIDAVVFNNKLIDREDF